MRRRQLVGAPIAMAALGLVGHGRTHAETAEQFPSKPIRIVVPIANGSASDTLMRAIATTLATQERWNVIVENKPGAGGAIGAEEVARATPDGYTLVSGNGGSHAVTPLAMRDVKYDPERDFKPISLVQLGPLFIVAGAHTGIDSYATLVKRARASRSAVSFASAGTAHSAIIQDLALRNGFELNVIAYKGSGPALTDVMGGHVDLFMDTGIATLPAIKSGKVRAIAVTSARRSPLMPDLPTVAELGNPGFDDAGLTALFAPARTPDAVVQKLASAVRKAVATPSIQELIASNAGMSVNSTPQELATWLHAENVKWKARAQRVGLRAE